MPAAAISKMDIIQLDNPHLWIISFYMNTSTRSNCTFDRQLAEKIRVIKYIK